MLKAGSWARFFFCGCFYLRSYVRVYVWARSLRHDDQPAPDMAPIAARRMSPSQALTARRGFGVIYTVGQPL